MFKKSSLPYFLGLSIFGALLLHLFVFVTPASAQTPPPSHTYYIHQDHLSSVVTVTDENGSPVKQNKFFPYGKVETSNTSINDRLERGYTSQIKDTRTTLSYYNARYYDPTLSRFISVDSTGDGMNLYAYVGGNPMNANDPSGNRSRCARGSKCWLKNRGRKSSRPGSTLNAPAPGITSTSVFGGTVGSGTQSNVYASFGDRPWEDINLFLPNEEVYDFAMVRGLGAGIGLTCLSGQLWACKGISLLLGGAFTEYIASGGKSSTLMPLAMTAGGVATLGYSGIQITKAANTIWRFHTYHSDPVANFRRGTSIASRLGGATIIESTTTNQPVSPARSITDQGSVLVDPARLPYRSGSVNILTLDLQAQTNAAGQITGDIDRVVNRHGTVNILSANHGAQAAYSEAMINSGFVETLNDPTTFSFNYATFEKAAWHERLNYMYNHMRVQSAISEYFSYNYDFGANVGPWSISDIPR